MSAPTAPETDPLAAGRAALDAADWDAARARFEEAVAADPAPEAWEGMSWAAWWQGDHVALFPAREKAFRGYRQGGDACGAARMAMWLASDNFDFRGDDAVASAWLRRAQDLVAGGPACPEQGYILLLAADFQLFAGGDPDGAIAKVADALELGRALGDRGIEAVGLSILGGALIARGEVTEGLQRLDECAALAVAEHFEFLVAPGWALCHTVSACTSVGDFARAGQWCRAMHSWSERWHGRHFFGVCRSAYGDVLATSGDWGTAEEELASALADMTSTRPAMAGTPAVRLGRLRASQGDVAAARELYEAALPLPAAVLALGELDMDAGDPSAGVDAADRVLRNLTAPSVLDRFPALELRARAAARAGDAALADDTAAELEAIAQALGTPYMRGRARLVLAEVTAADQPDAARRAAEDAVDHFARSAAPYDSARARLVLAGALRALGREDRAAAEERAAADALDRLRSPAAAGGAAEELSPRETEILRLVAQGMADAQIAERLFLSPHTVHRHVANIRAKLRTPSRAAAVAYATRTGLL